MFWLLSFILLPSSVSPLPLRPIIFFSPHAISITLSLICVLDRRLMYHSLVCQCMPSANLTTPRLALSRLASRLFISSLALLVHSARAASSSHICTTLYCSANMQRRNKFRFRGLPVFVLASLKPLMFVLVTRWTERKTGADGLPTRRCCVCQYRKPKTGSLYWSKSAQRAYDRRHPGQPNKVQLNDAFFALHAMFVSFVTLAQVILTIVCDRQ